MIFVFIKDGSLEILDSESEVIQECEGIDVENGEYEFYDANGTYLKPIFTSPNIHTKSFFGIFKSVQSGLFKLSKQPKEEINSFEIMLRKTTTLIENKYFKTLNEIKVKFNVTGT